MRSMSASRWSNLRLDGGVELKKLAFRELPFVAQLATMLTFYCVWVLIEELIIDRQGLYRYLPLYRFGQFCTYDAVVLVVLIFLWVRWNAKAST